MKRTDVSVTKEEEEEEKVSQQLWCAMYGKERKKRATHLEFPEEKK